MNRLDRTMGMLLLLRDGRAVSATDLAARFEISVRTVYRDLETLSALGVPVVAEMGRNGGFRLGEGYFLPPITLGTEEAVSLLLGQTLMRRLRVMPFAKEAEMAERKLLAALPPETRSSMERAARLIGFERVPSDLMHSELADPQSGKGPPPEVEGEIVGSFLRAVIARSRVTLAYRSPYRDREEPREVEPLGLLWDRDRWYLVGRVAGSGRRTWRADRVLSIGPGRSMPPVRSDFDAGELLERRWLAEAMGRWRAESPARVAMRADQAERLKRDWFYGQASFEEAADGRVEMLYGEYRPEDAAALVRWLGPGAELLEPAAWRPMVEASLREMLAAYE
jgi:predicted DNA-binding transcriptional regulator YafY